MIAGGAPYSRSGNHVVTESFSPKFRCCGKFPNDSAFERPRRLFRSLIPALSSSLSSSSCGAVSLCLQDGGLSRMRGGGRAGLDWTEMGVQYLPLGIVVGPCRVWDFWCVSTKAWRFQPCDLAASPHLTSHARLYEN